MSSSKESENVLLSPEAIEIATKRPLPVSSRSRKRRSRQKYSVSLIKPLAYREIRGSSFVIKRAIEYCIEAATLLRKCMFDFPTPPDAKSTISASFSSDGTLLASSHGDHTIKIFSTSSGRLLQTLKGHFRTPWNVKFHPRKRNLVASGCLGYQVRVWDLNTSKCIMKDFLFKEIVSLSFHPFRSWLAIASGKGIYIWNYSSSLGFSPWLLLERKHHTRAVEFTCDGKCLITAEATPEQNSKANCHYLNGRKEYTALLLHWQLNIDGIDKAFSRGNPTLFNREDAFISKPKEIIKNAALYSDGGFGISADGHLLCAISYEIENNEEADQEGAGICTSNDDGKFYAGKGSSGSLGKLSSAQNTGIDTPTKLRRSSFLRTAEQGQHCIETSGQSPGSLPFSRRIFKNTLSRRQEDCGVFKLIVVSLDHKIMGHVEQYRRLNLDEAKGITSVKFSPTGNHIVVGRGVNVYLRHLEAERGKTQLAVASIYKRYTSEAVELFTEFFQDEDSSNIALFNPCIGQGFVYGTRKGALRSFF